MTGYVAFLGGINVGGHRVTMAALRAEFEQLGLTDVGTFIASGNVLFDARERAATLEPKIEAHLAARLGYAVPTFVRTAGEVVKAAAEEPFGPISGRDTHLVAFLRAPPTPRAKRATAALSNERDRFAVRGKDVHWLIHGGVADSSVKSSLLVATIGHPFTTRNTKSLRKLATALSTG